MVFRVPGQVEFRDTDAAGVVYFANLLAYCHRAYERSLMESGIDLRQFFSSQTLAFPITQSSLRWIQPLFPGDRYIVELVPKSLTDDSFEIDYRLLSEKDGDKPIGRATTTHVCIDPHLHKRRALPEEIKAWIQRWSDPVEEVQGS